jgi:cadmium resistance protein CadD (predicted permease)
MFAVTNVDDLVMLAVFFGRAPGLGARWRIVAGQYLGFGAILLAAVLGGLGAGLLPEAVIPYLGLVPLLLGLRAAWNVWRERHEPDDSSPDATGLWGVAAVTFANGGDNIGVYVPVFAVAGAGGMTVYVVVFLIGLAVLCAAGWYLATRPLVAKALARWGHIVLPVVLIAIGLVILIQGHAFAL